MADKKSRKLPPKLLQEDIDALDALDAITDYKPSNEAYSKVNATAIRTATQAKEAKSVQDDAQAHASRDSKVMSQWDRHEFVLGMRKQVVAQYGENSDEVQAVGLKKKSEYKKPTKKKTTTIKTNG